jgi:hypothetical protein
MKIRKGTEFLQIRWQSGSETSWGPRENRSHKVVRLISQSYDDVLRDVGKGV